MIGIVKCLATVLRNRRDLTAFLIRGNAVAAYPVSMNIAQSGSLRKTRLDLSYFLFIMILRRKKYDRSLVIKEDIDSGNGVENH